MKADDLFHIKFKNLKPESGRLLLSYPTLNDFYFKRAVILLTEHNEKGSIGFVLNKEIKVSLNTLLSDFPEMDAYVSIGGPVSPETLHFVHCLGAEIPGSVHLGGSVYWGGDFEVLKELIIAERVAYNNIRFFLGYSGWAEGQLEQELEQGSWLVLDSSNVPLFEQKKVSWKALVDKMGEDFRLWKNFPVDPTLN